MRVQAETQKHAPHVVQFYSDDDELVASVTQHLIDGFRRGEVAVVIATPRHRVAIARACGTRGNIVTLDAAETLEAFMVDGRPDAGLFDAVVGDAVRGIAIDGHRARAFGEMVALLWDQGNVTGALELEELWNQLLDEVGFSLFCAYPTSILAGDQGTPLAEVCALHSDVVGTCIPDVNEDASASMGLPYSMESPARARRFVTNMLSHWGFGRLVPDAALVVTELSTNAILHGKGDFIVTLSCHPGAVRIDVEDSSDTQPARATRGQGSINGRGLVLVDAIATSWGVKSIGRGKVVWAELRNLRAVP